MLSNTVLVDLVLGLGVVMVHRGDTVVAVLDTGLQCRNVDCDHWVTVSHCRFIHCDIGFPAEDTGNGRLCTWRKRWHIQFCTFC